MWRISCLVLVCVLLIPCAASGATGSTTSGTVGGIATGNVGLSAVQVSAAVAAKPEAGAAVPGGTASGGAKPGASGTVEAAPLPKDMSLTRQKPNLKIFARYPELGIAAIDSDIREWVTQLVDNFEEEFSGETADARVPYEMNATYTLLRPSLGSAVTVVWEVDSYTQGAHGNLDIMTSIYRLPDGEPVAFDDLFADVSTALNLLSERSYAQLSRTLGDMLDEDMLRGGTSPDPDNFSSIALIPGGVRVFFQPYQVAPWAAGPQTVDVLLEDLEDAGPKRALWGLTEEKKVPPVAPL